MNHIFWWGKEDLECNPLECGSAWTEDNDTANNIASAMKKDGWDVLLTYHSTLDVRVVRGYEAAAERLQKARDEE